MTATDTDKLAEAVAYAEMMARRAVEDGKITQASNVQKLLNEALRLLVK